MQTSRKSPGKYHKAGTNFSEPIAPFQVYEEIRRHNRSPSRSHKKNFVDAEKYSAPVKNIYPTPIAPFEICESEDPHSRRSRNSSAMKRIAANSKEAATKLCNRMIMCMFAVLLLFATSLQVCVAIVGTSIKAPSFSSVVKNCKYAFGVVQEQSDYYAECTERQIATCRDVLDATYIQETFRVQMNQQTNAHFLNAFQNAVGNCSSSVSLAKGAVSAWTAQGVKYEIPYYGNCSGVQKQAAVSLLGGTNLQRTNVYVAANSYSQESDNTVTRLATYSVALSSYNAQYLHNKTRSLQKLAQQIVDQAALPRVARLSTSFDPVFDVVNVLLACVSLTDTPAVTCPYPNTLLSGFTLARQAFTNAYNNLVNFFLDVRDSAERYKAMVIVAMQSVTQFYDSIQGAQGLVKYLSNNLGIGNICGKTTPNFCSFNPSMWTLSNVMFPTLPLQAVMATASQIWASVSDIPGLEILKIKAMAVKLKADLNLMVEEIKVSIALADFTPKDYNPPSYPNAEANVTFEIAAQTLRSSNFAAEVQGLLSATNVTSMSDLADSVSSNVNTTAFLTYAESILSQYSISSASFESVNIDVQLILNSIFAVQSVFFLFDYLYRVYQTVHLISRFWRRGVVQLPTVDLRSKKPDVSGVWFRYLGYFLQILPFFSLQLMLLAAFIIILIWGFAALYVPSLNAYSASCVYHTTNSTFLSRNLDSLAYNYAVSDGNSIVTKGITKFNAKSAGYCMGSASNSLQSYTSMLNTAYEANQTLANNIKSLNQLEQCVDLNALDTQFQRACCGQNDYIYFNSGYGSNNIGGSSSGYDWINTGCTASSFNCPMQPASTSSLTTSPYLPPGYYASQTACTSDNLLYADASTGDVVNAVGAIRPSAFNCKALPLCEVSCTEPDRSTITMWSKHCACMVEWYMNGAILQTLVALLTYLILNISRIIVLEKGILVLWWRELTPEIFDYIANCDSNGKILNHALHDRDKEGGGKGRKRNRDDLESGQEPRFRAALSEAIDAKIQAYERKGWVMIMLGLAINLIWIVLVIELRNDIAYRP